MLLQFEHIHIYTIFPYIYIYIYILIGKKHQFKNPHIVVSMTPRQRTPGGGGFPPGGATGAAKGGVLCGAGG